MWFLLLWWSKKCVHEREKEKRVDKRGGGGVGKRATRERNKYSCCIMWFLHLRWLSLFQRLNYFWVCDCVLHEHGCRCLRSPEEGVWSPRAGVTDSVTHLTWVLRTELRSSVRASALIVWANSSPWSLELHEIDSSCVSGLGFISVRLLTLSASSRCSVQASRSQWRSNSIRIRK